MEKMPHDDAADFCLVARSGRTADSGKATVKSEIRVGELEGANGAVLEPGICPLGMEGMPHAEALVPVELR